jgi:hypothetical protein
VLTVAAMLASRQKAFKKAENQLQLVSGFLVRVLIIERHYRRVYAD